MSQSVWPNDHTATEDSYGIEKSLDELICFVICPFKPPEYWNDLFAQIQALCNQLGQQFGVRMQCRRAVDIVSTGFIHPEIWRDIRSADFLIADITGYNGNVMFELGVAAAWLDKDRVIIIREDRPEDTRLFDLNPARQLDYTRSPSGFCNLLAKLFNLMQDAVARAPFEQTPDEPLALPVSLDLMSPEPARKLWGLSGAHRRTLPYEGLEFGSLYNFRFGWLAVGNIITRNVHVTAELRFSSPRIQGTPYPPWMGVMLRSQGYLASSGHLALLRTNGQIAFTEEVRTENGTKHQDRDIDTIPAFDPTGPDFTLFDIIIDETAWTIRVGGIERIVPLIELSTTFNEGRIIIEGQFCWVLAKSLRVELL